MRKQALALFAVFALFLMACDVSGLVGNLVPSDVKKQVEDQAQQVEPTIAALATQVPASQPTSKSQPTTKAASSGSSTGNPLRDAANKAKDIKKFRIQFSMIFGSMDKGKYTETPFMNFKGEVDGENWHFTSTGGILAMLAGSDKAQIEMVVSKGTTYMKGVSMFGMTDPKLWYITDDSSSSSFDSFAKPDQFNDWLGGSDPSNLKKVRTEQLDGQSCDVYVSDSKALQDASLLGALGSAGSKDDFSVVDKAEMDFWLCRDGYVHQFQMDYEGHNAKDATQKGAMKLLGHTWDYNNPAITVQVPKDAKPLPK